jgi:outer membrane protein assembly factor BamB
MKTPFLSAYAAVPIFVALSIQLVIAQESSVKQENKVAREAEGLWAAARKGDLDSIKSMIAAGVPVDSKTDYGATALSFAASRGNKEIVQLLLSEKADPNVKDNFYNATPMAWASMGKHYDIMKQLALAGADDTSAVLTQAINKKDVSFVTNWLKSGRGSRPNLKSNLELAKNIDAKDIAKLIEDKLASIKPSFLVEKKILDSYKGIYGAEDGVRIAVDHSDGYLTLTFPKGKTFDLEPKSAILFEAPKSKLKFKVVNQKVASLELDSSNQKQVYTRLTEAELAVTNEDSKKLDAPNAEPSEPEKVREFAESSARSRAADLAISSSNWPQFRGNGARGVADGQKPPIEWDSKESDKNLLWKTEIKGLGHSCPVIWGNLLFITTAISEKDTGLQTGLYGDVASVDDDSEHEFVTVCMDKRNGKVVWRRTACKKVPSVKRHLKSTHANSSIATNGKYVISWFASEGVYCYSMEGKLVWKKDLGLLDSGWFYDRDFQWQFGASPIIHNDRLILLCDIQDQSFIATYDLASGKEIWKTDRDEIPSWSSPTVIDTPSGLTIVTNATKASRGYSFQTGEQIWQIKKNSEIAVPTPFTAHGLIYVSSGYRPIQPIYAIRLDAEGDLTLAENVQKSEYISWSESRGGPYMPTPIVYGDYLYICSNSGILTCYQAITGEQVYKKRLRMKGLKSFVGSPIAADGHLYITSEDGETAVIKAGPKFQLVANNFCGESCLTTPAISEGTFFVRSQRHVFAFANKAMDETNNDNGIKDEAEKSNQDDGVKKKGR